MEILLLCGIYLVELACFWLVLRILFEVQYKTKVVMIFGLVLPVIVAVLPIEDVLEKSFLIAVSVLGVIFVSIEGTILEKGAELILTFLLLECVDGIILPFWEQILENLNIYFKVFGNCLATKCCTLGTILLLNIVKEKMNHKEMHINSIIYIIIGIVASSMMFCLAFLNRVVIHLHNSKYTILCNALNVAILISIFLLVVFVIYIKNTHERMEQLLKTEQLLKESQVSYYKQVLKKEKDTRKYRHDMVNHLVYIQDTLSRNKIDDAQQYLANIMGGFKKIQNAYYMTGNEMVDTIMNYFCGMIPKSVNVEIKGRCPVEIDMEDTDVCTIFSNLFQNAVEEIIENKINNAKIIVGIQRGKQYVMYSIKNSLVTEIYENNISKMGLPKSHKKDKHNHGIGMVNAKSTIERNSGKFEWYQVEGYFCVNIILPIKYE